MKTEKSCDLMAKTRKYHEDPVMEQALNTIKSQERRDRALGRSRASARVAARKATFRTDFTVQKPFLWKKADRNGTHETEDPGLGN